MGAVAACHGPTITIKHSAGPAGERSIAGLLDLASIDRPPVSGEGAEVFTYSLSRSVETDSLALFEQALRRVKEAAPVTSHDPLFELRIIEKDPKILAAMRLGPGDSRAVPLEFDPARGWDTLGEREPLLGDKMRCFYYVALLRRHPPITVYLPTDDERPDVKPIHYEIVTLDSELRAEGVRPEISERVDGRLAFDLSFDERRDFSPVIDAEQCRVRILRSEAAFFRKIVFPALAGRIESFEIKGR